MKLNTRQLELLRSIAHAPRRLHDMTGGLESCAPATVHGWLDHFVEAGFVTEPQTHREPYTITEDGRCYLDSLPQIVPAVLICAASMREPYTGTRWNIREGGESHKQYRSLTA